jgi:hypothetical protein
MIRFDVFGTLIGVERAGDQWRVYYIGAKGKRRIADDVVIPPSIEEGALAQYLADLRHEYATPGYPAVRRVM